MKSEIIRARGVAYWKEDPFAVPSVERGRSIKGHVLKEGRLDTVIAGRQI